MRNRLHPNTTLLGLLSLGLALSGCGAVHSAQPTAVHRVPAGGVKGDRAERSPTRVRRLFAPTSFWNRAVASYAPLDPNSEQLVTALGREVSEEEASKRGPWINTTSYGVAFLTVEASQPTVPVALDHAPDPALSSAWSAVPLPSDAQPAQGSDGNLVVWQPSSDRMWEFWRLRRTPDGWQASWGGALDHVSRNPGVFGAEAWPGAKPWWGATASSLALAGGLITIADLRRGRIDHALAIAAPLIRSGVFASPAQRTDGSSRDPSALPEGAHLRLDPNLDLASLKMPPLTRMIAAAAQRYGIFVRDFAGNVAFFGEDPTATGSNPYVGAGGFYEGLYPSELLASFPWSHLQVLRMQLHPNP